MNSDDLYNLNMAQIETLDPRAQPNFVSMLKECWAKQWFFKIVPPARRTVAYQLWLYSSGRSRPGPIVTDTVYGSAHLKGLAADIIPVNGETYDNLESISTQFGITRPLKNTSLADLDHYEFTGSLVDVPEPVIDVNPVERIRTLNKRLLRATGDTAKAIIDAISILTNVIQRRNNRE